jgi:alpha-beta hydrolase superfamily lysophospholipase
MLHFVRRHPRSFALRLLGVVIILLLAGLLLAPAARAQAPQDAPQGAPRNAAVLLMKGADTILVQRSYRTATTVRTVVAARGAPRVTVLYRLAPSHLITGAEFSVQGANSADDAPTLQRGTITLGGDTAHIVIRAGPNERVIRPATSREALPLFNNDFTVLEQGVRLARARNVDSLPLSLLALSNGQTLPATLVLFAPDSARLSVMGNATVASVDAAGNVTGGYLPGQDIRLVVATGAEAAGIALGAPSYAAPPGAPYIAEDVRVRTPAGHELAGTLTLPRQSSVRVPAVVTITGSGQQDRDESIPTVPGFRIFRQVADTLSRRGIAVLRLDDRGVGGSAGDVNGTSADFADDIRAAVAYLRTRSEIDPARIALVGHSEGGMIAPMLAADDPRLAAIVLMAGPAIRGRDVINFQIRNAVESDTSIAVAARDSATHAFLAGFDSTTAKQPWMAYFLAYDPIPTVRRVRQPVLILQGATDLQVTADQAPMLERALRDAGNRNVTVHVFKDRNHLFLRDASGSPAGYGALTDTRVDSEVMGTLADWLVSTLRPD